MQCDGDSVIDLKIEETRRKHSEKHSRGHNLSWSNSTYFHRNEYRSESLQQNNKNLHIYRRSGKNSTCQKTLLKAKEKCLLK